MDETPQRHFSSKTSILGLFAILSIVLTVPLALLLSQQRQDLRQQAAEPTPSLQPLSQSQGQGSLSGYVYLDQNQNGERDMEEKPFSNATVRITQVSNNPQHSKPRNSNVALKTDSNGYFIFKLSQSSTTSITYLIKVDLSDGYKTMNTNPVVFSSLPQNTQEIVEFGLYNANIPTPSCMPRPTCLDSVPRCLIPEPTGGWCPNPSVTVLPTPAPTTPVGCYYAPSICPMIACQQGQPCPTCSPILVCITPAVHVPTPTFACLGTNCPTPTK